MSNYNKNNLKIIFKRSLILLLIPLIISLILFNPFKKFEMKCSEDECKKVDSEISLRIFELNNVEIENFFRNKVLKELFGKDIDYNIYNIKITDLSDISDQGAINLVSRVSFRSNNYIIPYQKSILLKNVDIKQYDKIKINYEMNIVLQRLLEKDVTLRFDYEIIIKKRVEDFIIIYFIALISWLVLFRIFRKSYYYIRYDSRD